MADPDEWIDRHKYTVCRQAGRQTGAQKTERRNRKSNRVTKRQRGGLNATQRVNLAGRKTDY